MLLKPFRGIQLNKTHPLARGLVGCWVMNEGSGNKIFDLSGSGDEGILTSGVTWKAGRRGQALDFDGSGSYVDAGSALGTGLGNGIMGISVSLWFKADITGDNDGLFNIGNFSSSQGELNFNLQNNNLYFIMDNAGFSHAFGFSDTLAWHHLVGVYDGVRGKLYLDAVKVIDESFTNGLDLSGLKTIIGGYYSNSYCYNGLIDEVKVRNRALSADEVALLYRESYCIFQPFDPILWVAVAAGLSIPIAMKHLREQRIA